MAKSTSIQYPCAAGEHRPSPQSPEHWTDVAFPVGNLPPGVTLADIRIKFNVPSKSVVIDNFRLIEWVLGWPGLEVYVADTENNRIVRLVNWLDSGWVADWRTVGSLGNGPKQFNRPYGVALDALGRIYVADTFNHRIVRMNDMSGAGWTVYETGCSFQAFELCSPSSVYVDGLGRIYVTTFEGSYSPYAAQSAVIRIDDMSGAGRVSFGTGQFAGLHGIYLDGAWRIHVADLFNNRIVRFDDMAGSNLVSWGVTSCQGGWLSQPTGVFVEANGAVLISATQGLGRIPDVDAPSWCSAFDPTSAGGVSHDDQRIYYTQTSDGNIARMKDMSGNGLVLLGRTGSGVREFRRPRGIWVEWD
jgi:hypothetical protein